MVFPLQIQKSEILRLPLTFSLTWNRARDIRCIFKIWMTKHTQHYAKKIKDPAKKKVYPLRSGKALRLRAQAFKSLPGIKSYLCNLITANLEQAS